MGTLDTVKTKDWRRFLTSIGLHFSHIKASHEHWTKEGLIRNVVFRSKEKEIPIFHILTNLKTLGIDKDILIAFLLNK